MPIRPDTSSLARAPPPNKLSAVEVRGPRCRVIRSPEEEENSTVDGVCAKNNIYALIGIEIESLKRLAATLEKENEELEKRYDSEKAKWRNAKRIKLTEKVKTLKERQKELQSKLAGLKEEFDIDDSGDIHNIESSSP